MTPLSQIYDKFLNQIDDDTWSDLLDWEIDKDLRYILDNAISSFKFPRVPLTINEGNSAEDIEPYFENELSNDEIQVIISFMKVAWLERLVNSWENLRPMYSERDFSPAKMLGEFRGQLNHQQDIARKKEAVYYRSIKGKPFAYRNLAGGGH